MSMSPEYLAGFLDGEGCVMLVLNGPPRSDGVQTGYRPKVMIANTHLPILAEIAAQYGGRITQATQGSENWKAGYRVEWLSAHAIDLLRVVRPHLRIKGRQADIATRFYELQQARRKKHKTPEEIAMFAAMFAEIKELNRRGNPPSELRAVS